KSPPRKSRHEARDGGEEDRHPGAVDHAKHDDHDRQGRGDDGPEELHRIGQYQPPSLCVGDRAATVGLQVRGFEMEVPALLLSFPDRWLRRTGDRHDAAKLRSRPALSTAYA